MPRGPVPRTSRRSTARPASSRIAESSSVLRAMNYRLIVALACQLQILYIKCVGTHEEYEAMDAETIDMS